MRGAECKGLKGMAQGTKPVDLEWSFSFSFLQFEGKGGEGRREVGVKRVGRARMPEGQRTVETGIFILMNFTSTMGSFLFLAYYKLSQISG